MGTVAHVSHGSTIMTEAERSVLSSNEEMPIVPYEPEEERAYTIHDLVGDDNALLFEALSKRFTPRGKRVPTEEEYLEYELILQKKSKLSAKERKKLTNLIEEAQYDGK